MPDQNQNKPPEPEEPVPIADVVRYLSGPDSPLDGGFTDAERKTAANIADAESEVQALAEERAERLKSGEPIGDLTEQLLAAQVRLQQLRNP